MTALESTPGSAASLVDRIQGRSARDIGDGIERLIAAGDLAAGEQLPTIRDIAKAAEVSPGTVLTAWNRLRAAGLIRTHRRGGTIVVGTEADADEPRPLPAWATIDFLQCAPDITLQPDLREALMDSLSDTSLNVFGREYMTERLHHAVEPTWPFRAQAWTTAGGGTEGLLLAVAAATSPGAAVAVDEPASPGLLDTLRDLALEPIGVAADADGPLPESLRAAIEQGAVAFVFQPGAEFAADREVTPERATQLADVVAAAARTVWVVEDDAMGPLTEGPTPTLGERLPGQTVRVRSYCKAYGIDVRTSVIAGSSELVERSNAVRSHGVGSNSRILQGALAHLVRSAVADDVVARARRTYRSRRDTLVAELEGRGVRVTSGERSAVVWVEVADETDALVALAGHGISVCPASKAFVGRSTPPALRISPLQLPDDPQVIGSFAALVATAATAGSTRQFFS